MGFVLSADARAVSGLYDGDVVNEVLQSMLAEPRVPNVPRRVSRDWPLVGILAAGAMVELVVRTDLSSRPIAFVFGVLPLLTLLWRRTHPLAMVTIGFAAHTAAHLLSHNGDPDSATLYVSGYLLLLPYALFRWGSGRDALTGLVIMVIGHVPMVASVEDVIASVVFLLFPAVVGAAMRYRTSAKVREMDQVRLREREQLARELHDTVAHHVSAIIIQAQAGRTVAAANPDGALAALEVIEGEASRTLAEMRTMVGVLRSGGDPELAPQRGVADIERLALDNGDGPRVDVAFTGELDDLRPSVQAAIYRLAQESITNAVRHSRQATRIEVSVSADDNAVRLTVQDNGVGAAHLGTSGSSGYGLVGMAERAKLLGGTLECGPGADRGWMVSAVLPRDGIPV